MGKSKKNASFFVTYERTTETLTLIKRTPELRNILQIKNDQNYSIAYKPVTLHIGSATVGGVTTGGAYTTGGYNYISGKSDSGYYQFLFEGQNIKHIKLDEELFSIAKESEIAPYLNDETHEIIVVEEITHSEEEIRASIYNYRSTGYVGNVRKGYPSLDKTIKILAWLCDLEDEPDFVLKQAPNTIRLIIGLIISLGLLGLSGAALYMMFFDGYGIEAEILSGIIILSILGIIILACCMTSIVRRIKRNLKIKKRIKRGRA